MKQKRANSKRVVAIVLIILFSFVAIWELTTFFVSFFNYKDNCKMWNNNIGIINDQHLDGIKNYKYGFGTIGKNGCGAVAVYNIMYLENKKVSLPKIIKEMDNGQFFFGLLGTRPTQMMSYLKKQGFDVQLHEDKSRLKSLRTIANIAYILMLEQLADTTPCSQTTMTTQRHSAQSIRVAQQPFHLLLKKTKTTS